MYKHVLLVILVLAMPTCKSQGTPYVVTVLSCTGVALEGLGAFYTLYALRALSKQKPVSENASLEEKLKAYQQRVKREEHLWRGITIYFVGTVFACLKIAVKAVIGTPQAAVGPSAREHG